MENYANHSLYQEFLGYSYPNNSLKPKAEADTYRDPSAMSTDEKFCILGMGLEDSQLSPMMPLKEAPSPMATYETLSPMQDPMLGQAMGIAPEMESEVPSSLELPPYLAEMVDSLLISSGNQFPVNDFEQADLDMHIASLPVEESYLPEDELFTTTPLPPPSYEDSLNFMNPGVSSPQEPPQRRVRKTRKTKKVSLVEEEETVPMASPSPLHLGYDPYPSPIDMGVPSPASSSASGLSDTFDGEELGSGKKKGRRPRVSYSTLTEEEKYDRIRTLNNEASRNYRNRQRVTLSSLEQQIPQLLEKNKHLVDKAAKLQLLRDQMKQFSNTFLKQHMSQGQNGAGF